MIGTSSSDSENVDLKLVKIESDIQPKNSITSFSIETILQHSDTKNVEEETDFMSERKVEVLEDEEKESDGVTPSYTAIIAKAILSSSENKLSLGCIYDYIAKNFPEFLKKGQGWRNCVRHNLSLSECFIKAGRAKNGRGNYWGIHPRYFKNFLKGDYRKRRASHRPRQRYLPYGFQQYPLYPPTQTYIPVAVSKDFPYSKVNFSVNNILKTMNGNCYCRPKHLDVHHKYFIASHHHH